MDIEEIREIVREEFYLDGCERCSPEMLALLEMPIPPVTLTDVVGIQWCAEHQMRGEFINLMASLHWPEVANAEIEDEEGNITKCSVAAEAWSAIHAALTISDDAIFALGLKAVESHQESEDVA